jgi:RNA polymerase sigma factor (sigma-70 family)
LIIAPRAVDFLGRTRELKELREVWSSGRSGFIPIYERRRVGNGIAAVDFTGMLAVVSAIPPIIATDRECLEAWRRRPCAESLRPVVEHYARFVYSSAFRRTGNPDHAGEVTRAVFLVLARRARRLRNKTVLAAWLFRITSVACRKLGGKPKRTAWWRRLGRSWRTAVPTDATLWTRIAPELEAAIERLSPAQRDAVLLRVLLNQEPASAARILRTSERRVEKQVDRGLKKLTRRLRRRGVATDPDTLARTCAREGCAAPMPDGLVDEILASIDDHPGERPRLKLARRTLNTLAWARWRRRVAVGVPSLFLLLVMLVGTAWYVDSLTGHSRLISAFLVWSVKHEGKTVPGLAQPARPWPTDASSPRLNAAEIRTAEDLYRMTNIWLVHLKFTRPQWDALEPERIDPLPHFLQPDGTALLRNPKAQRSGLAGVLGFDFNWSSGDIDFGGMSFTNVAVRVKGNGTYLASLYGDKRPYKVDLNKLTKGQKLGGVDELTFNNLLNDFSCMSDALAYEFFREAGVPAPRTAYAYLSVSVENGWDQKPLGLYVMVEAVGEEFALEHFGSPKTPVFKPVTGELFKHLGDDWTAYEAIYDLKTEATAEQLQRVIEFARLVTRASDAEFARRLGEFLDLEKFARYLACEVLLSNYDSLLSNGQNFYLYLEPASNKFGFIPWDLDLSWGGFFLLGTTRDRERASIRHPWVGQHRLLERVMAVEEFQQLYRRQLEDLLARLFVPSRLHQRIDAVAQVIRSPIAAESDFRLRKFERAVSDQRRERSSEFGQGANRPAHQLKRFIEARAVSVRQQLGGKTEGIILKRSRRK